MPNHCHNDLYIDGPKQDVKALLEFMPNHCHNDLYIDGPKQDVKALLEFIKGEDTLIDFDKIIPYPEPYRSMDADAREFSWGSGLKYGSDEYNAKLEAYKAKWGTDKDGFNSGGYARCVSDWGTKWNAYETARRDYDGTVCITFQTAWSPPARIVAALAAKFPSLCLSLEWFERGFGECGGFYYPRKEYCEDYEKPHGEPTVWSGPYKGTRGG